MYNGVKLSLVAILGSTPCCNNADTQESWPSQHAMYNGVAHNVVAVLGSAPCCSSADAHES